MGTGLENELELDSLANTSDVLTKGARK